MNGGFPRVVRASPMKSVNMAGGGAADLSIVSKQLDAVGAHEGEEWLAEALEVVLAVASVGGRQFAAQDLLEKYSLTTGRL